MTQFFMWPDRYGNIHDITIFIYLKLDLTPYFAKGCAF